MIVVVGRVVGEQARREELLAVGHAVARASREEEGCIGYRLYEDTELAGEFVFVEEWASQEALDRHFRTAHVADFMAGILPTLSAPPDVKFHTIASSIDLGDLNVGG